MAVECADDIIGISVTVLFAMTKTGDLIDQFHVKLMRELSVAGFAYFSICGDDVIDKSSLCPSGHFLLGPSRFDASRTHPIPTRQKEKCDRRQLFGGI